MEKRAGKNRMITALSVGVACVWFSTHFGAGFASGTQLLSYYSSNGWMALLMIICTVAIQAVTFYIGLELARRYSTKNYRELGEKIYMPLEKVGALLFEISWLMTIFLGIAGCLSGGANVLYQSFGIPLLLGTILFAVCVALIAAFGIKVVRSCSTVLTVLILVLIVIISSLGIANAGDNLHQIISQRQVFTSWKDALVDMITYAGFQCAVIAIAVCTAIGIKSKKESVGATFLGALLNIAMMGLMAVMLLGYMPTVTTDPDAAAMPTLYVVNQLGKPILVAACSLLLMLAYITSGVTEVFAISQRFSPMILKGFGEKHPKTKEFIVCIVICFICWLVSQMGLLWIVQTGYKYLGIINIFLIIIPFVTIGLYNMLRSKKSSTAVEGEV